MAKRPANTNLRALALIGALQRHGADAQRLLTRHPAAAQLATLNPPADLPALLWTELVELESEYLQHAIEPPAPGAGTAPEYFQRRRRLGQLEAWSRLPSLWRQLLLLSGTDVKRTAIDIGLAAIAWSAFGVPSQKLMPFFGPLGSELALRVVNRIRRGAPPPTDGNLPSRWREQYQLLARSYQGDRLAEKYARSILAGLSTRLNARDLTLAAGVGRSNIVEVIRRTDPIDLGAPGEFDAIQQLVESIVGRSSTPREPKP